MSRLPRDLHPVAWWVWAIGLAAAASMTTNPLLLLAIVLVAALVVAARRSDHPWSRSFRLYLWLALAIVVIRVLFRVLLGGGPAADGGTVMLHLPEVPLPAWVAGVRLVGDVTSSSVLAGLYDGMRLAAIVVCVGAANALANPKRLLRSMPAALYEVGTAMVVAITVLPQLADSVRRVRAAQQLRGGPSGRTGRLRRLVVPVLEDALERSVRLAAGMDARGYGRSGGLGRAQRIATGGLMLAGLCGLCVGTYAVLDTTAPRWLATPMLVVGALAAVAGLVSAGRRVVRTRYRPDHWQPAEVGVALTGVLEATSVVLAARTDLLLVHPGVEAWPTLTLPLLLGTLVAALPAVLAPRPTQSLAVASPDLTPSEGRRTVEVAA